jgi:thioredoxin reductase (NADPH)
MTVLTTADGDRSAATNAFSDDARLVVVSLCAAWCDTCNEFRAAYERIAKARPQIAFVWLDIEDDAAIAGDIDVENFPTLAVYRGGVPLHFGVSLPHESTVLRLIDALAQSGSALRHAPPAVAQLPEEFLHARAGDALGNL